ncbi:hypothetical protein PI124_g17498 [Phytophthora idaei]|nr:hypothetical protein PI125_g18086 [Phytophthora idaei]KAG3142635.1 hypothetical protein PI126_g14963 [Phytophthora idaei]KAG3237520.1 hypothetical protein PI124_g17498 [Phytophthora idaei]
MVAPPIAIGSLAFIGLPRVPAPTEFHYIRVTVIDRETVQVSLAAPDGADDDFYDPISLTILRLRQVAPDEAGLWSGMSILPPLSIRKVLPWINGLLGLSAAII